MTNQTQTDRLAEVLGKTLKNCPNAMYVPVPVDLAQSLSTDLANAEARVKASEEENARLKAAAAPLLNACYAADAKEELAPSIDGSLLGAMSEAIWPAIWSDDQVEALNAFQNGYGHPFTCGNDRGDDAHVFSQEEHGGDLGQLVATRQGWVCLACDYRQFWAHDHMFKGAIVNPFTTRDALNPGKESA